jgi:hypothetical protein
MVVKTIDRKATAVRLEKQGDDQYISTVLFENEKRATMIYEPTYGFSIVAEKDKKHYNKPISSDFFKLLILDILKFFLNGKAPFDINQTREVMSIRSALVNQKDKLGEWIKL